MTEVHVGEPPEFNESVLTLCERFSSSGEDDDSVLLDELYQLLSRSNGGLTPDLAVRIVVSNGMAFIPRLCAFITLRVSLDQSKQVEQELVQSVYLLKRLVLVVIDKERELHKVGDLLFKNGMVPCFDAILNGWMDELTLPEEPEEGEMRGWVMTIVRHCYHYDKMKQLGKVDELYEVLDALFKDGFYGKVVQIFGAGPITQTTEIAATLLQGVSDCPRTKYREKLRKSGVVMLASTRLTSMPSFRMASILLYNMSRSLSTHNSLRDADLLATAMQLVPKYGGGSSQSQPEMAGGQDGADHDPVVQLSITLAVANVYGTAEDDMQEAHAFLSEQHIAEQVIQMIRNSLDGLDGIPEVLDWEVSLDESVFMAFCLSQHGWLNDGLVEAGIIDVLKQVLEMRDEAALPGVRTLLNLCYSPHICSKIREIGLNGPLNDLMADSSDLRISDAATGCLVRLGGLGEKQKLSWKGRSITDLMSLVSPAEGEAAEGGGHQDRCFNVFLSHRRRDSKDFARALFNLLTQRGYTTYLDFEYLKDLGDLRDSVRRSDNLIFILSDTIFDSYWCKEELMTAIDAGVNIILVVKEGSKWSDQDGRDVYDFPPQDLIAELPESAQKVFNTAVAIKHSDEYYQSFVEKVLSRLVEPESANATAPPPKGASPPASASGREYQIDAGDRHQRVPRLSLTVPGSEPGQGPVWAATPKPAALGMGHQPTNNQSALLAAEKLQASFTSMCLGMEATIRTSNSTEMQHLRHELSKELANMHREITAEISQTKREFSADISEVKRVMTSEIGTMKASLTEMTDLLQRIVSSQQAAASVMASSQQQVRGNPSSASAVGHADARSYSSDGVKLIDQNGGTYRIMNTPMTAQDEIDIRQIHQHELAPGSRVRPEQPISSSSSLRSQAGMQQRPAGLAAESSYETAGPSIRSYSGHRNHKNSAVIPPGLQPSQDGQYLQFSTASMLAPETVLPGNRAGMGSSLHHQGLAVEKHGNGMFPSLMVDYKKPRK